MLSIALLALQAIVWMTDQGRTPQSLMITLVLMLLVAAVAVLVVAAVKQAFRLAGWAVVLVVAFCALLYFSYSLDRAALVNWTNILLPIGVALLATFLLMGRFGLRAFAV